MIRQFAVAVLSAGALAACVPTGDGMTPYSSGYASPMAANPLAQMLAAATGGYGAQAPYGSGYGAQTPYYQAAPQPMYAPQPQVIYMPQQAAPTYGRGYGGSYGAGRATAPAPRRVAADRDGNGVPDWRERDRNADGTPDYQQRTRRTR